MGRIGNTDKYSIIGAPTIEDYVIGTDKDNSKKTKNFLLGSIWELFDNIENDTTPLNYRWSDGTDLDIDYNTQGYFFTNDDDDNPSAVTQLIFNKFNVVGEDLTVYFTVINENKEKLRLRIGRPNNTNVLNYYEISNMTEYTNYVVFDVSIVDTMFTDVFTDETLYMLGLDLTVGKTSLLINNGEGDSRFVEETELQITDIDALTEVQGAGFYQCSPDFDLSTLETNSFYKDNTAPSGTVTADAMFSNIAIEVRVKPQDPAFLSDISSPRPDWYNALYGTDLTNVVDISIEPGTQGDSGRVEEDVIFDGITVECSFKYYYDDGQWRFASLEADATSAVDPETYWLDFLDNAPEMASHTALRTAKFGVYITGKYFSTPTYIFLYDRVSAYVAVTEGNEDELVIDSTLESTYYTSSSQGYNPFSVIYTNGEIVGTSSLDYVNINPLLASYWAPFVDTIDLNQSAFRNFHADNSSLTDGTHRMLGLTFQVEEVINNYIRIPDRYTNGSSTFLAPPKDISILVNKNGVGFVEIEGTIGELASVANGFPTSEFYIKSNDINTTSEIGTVKLFINADVGSTDTRNYFPQTLAKGVLPNAVLNDPDVSHNAIMETWFGEVYALFGAFAGSVANAYTSYGTSLKANHIQEYVKSNSADLYFGAVTNYYRNLNEDSDFFTVIPVGSNTLERLDRTDREENLYTNAVLVTSREDADLGTDPTGTAYGFGTEFNELTKNSDLVALGISPFSTPESHQQSPATAIVAGKMKYIRDITGAPWYVIRKACRENASHANDYNIYVGFGIIDVAATVTDIQTNYLPNLSVELGKTMEQVSPFNNKLLYVDKGLDTATTKRDLIEVSQTSIYDNVKATTVEITSESATTYMGETWWSLETKLAYKAVTLRGTNKWQEIGMKYDESNDTFKHPQTDDGQTLNDGQESFFSAYNDNGAGATELEPRVFVAISAKVGEENTKNVVLAIASDLAQGSVYGINTTNLAATEYGKVVTYGDVNGVNTSAWLVNTQLYASNTPGILTDTKPNTSIFPIAIVHKQHATEGILSVNTKSAQAGGTTVIAAGFDRIFYTADEITLGTGDYILGKRNDLGAVAELTGAASVPDDSQVALDVQSVGTPIGFPISFPSGVYTGQIEYQVAFGNRGEQRFRLEYYKAQTDGTPIDSGVLSEPVGLLGVRPALRTVSQIGNPLANTTTYLSFLGFLDQEVPLGATERIRVVFICEKIGTAGASQDFTIYFGSDHSTYTDTPSLGSISDNIDVDTSASVTDMFLKKNTSGVWQGSNIETDDVDGLAFITLPDTPSSFAGKASAMLRVDVTTSKVEFATGLTYDDVVVKMVVAGDTLELGAKHTSWDEVATHKITFQPQFSGVTDRIISLPIGDGTLAFNTEINGLVEVDDGGGIGWRFRNVSTAKLATIGIDAIDFSNDLSNPVFTRSDYGPQVVGSVAMGAGHVMTTGHGGNGNYGNHYAFGNSNEVRGYWNNVAIGTSNIINDGYCAMAIGWKNTLNPESAIGSVGTMGTNNALASYYNYSLGVGLDTRSVGAVAVGVANLIYAGGITAADRPVFTVGNGTIDTGGGSVGDVLTRSNAFQVLHNGNAEVFGDLKVGSTTLFSNANITIGGYGTHALAPANDSHIANKLYVDTSIAAIETIGFKGNLVADEVVGEAVVAGDFLYLNTDGKYWKTNADTEATSSTELGIATETAGADDPTTISERGSITSLSGLTAGTRYYLDESDGTITNDRSTFSSGSISRYVGTAKSTTVLKFNPSGDYTEIL